MYYLGIDGGGTKTAFALSDATGRILRTETLGPSNPIDIGLPASFDCLERGIRLVLQEIPTSDVSVFAGIAGGISGGNQEKLKDFFDRFGFFCVDNGSDAQNMVKAGLGDENGIAVIMGTGSVTFVQTESALIRLGGYGYLFEEGGSGYTLGRDAIMAALAAEEGSGEATLLGDLLLESLQASSMTSALSKLYEGGKRLIASFAPLVFDAYDKGDVVACHILRNNAGAIADAIRRARAKLPMAKYPVPVVLAGGLTAKASVFIPVIYEALTDSDAYRITVLDCPPVMGALMLAGATIKEEQNDKN